jgi:hypothetical protein
MPHPTWIFCCGMYRSGSTVQYQIAAEIVERSKLGQRVGSIVYDDFIALSEKYKNTDTILVAKAHHCFEEARESLSSGGAKGIYSYRDLRDVVVSWSKKNEFKIAEVLQSDFIDLCLDGYYQWTTAPHVLVSRYEDFFTDLTTETAQIAAHLGVKLAPETIRNIAEAFSLENQKTYLNKFDFETQGFVYNADIRVDLHSGLHSNHIRSGAAGEWKQELTDTEVAAIEQKCLYWLAGRSYSLAQVNGHTEQPIAPDEIARFEQAYMVSALRLLQVTSDITRLNSRLNRVNSRYSRLHWRVAKKIDRLWDILFAEDTGSQPVRLSLRAKFKHFFKRSLAEQGNPGQQ